MNRNTALFVALAVLVAHSLAIRTNAGGELATPYDQAFEAYRIASRWVYEGSFSWNAGTHGLESTPSPLWVVLCGLGERLYLPISDFVRFIGILASAASFFLASRFHPDRSASLITPMLLSISGAMAAAAVSGTETALLTAFVTFAFLAFERGWHRWTGVALLLAGLTRSEAWILLPAFLFLRQRARRREARGISGPPAAPLSTFATPLIGLVGMLALRAAQTGHPLPAWLADVTEFDPGRISNGLSYLRDFFVSTASPLLLVYSLWFAVRGKLTHTGAHSLGVFFAYASVVVLRGGGSTPFAETLVPVLPAALIGAQEALIIALNSMSRGVRGLAWVSFIGAVMASALASLPPRAGDSLLARAVEAWSVPSASPRFGFEDRLGRAGLDEELRATHALRGVGIFLRDEAPPTSSVLTPWPGSIGYLSRLEVRDLLGRVTAAPPRERPNPFEPLPRVDVLAALEEAPDYIVAFWRQRETLPRLESLVAGWCEDLDSRGAEPSRPGDLLRALEPYELVTLPLPDSNGRPTTTGALPVLRRRDLGFAPKLAIEGDAQYLTLRATHEGHQQLADLVIFGRSPSGATLCLTPEGELSTNVAVRARANLLLSPTGDRAVTLFKGRLDERVAELDELRAVLVNPGASFDLAEGRVSPEVVLPLE